MDIKDFQDSFNSEFEAEKLINLMRPKSEKYRTELDALDWEIMARILAREFVKLRHEHHVLSVLSIDVAERYAVKLDDWDWLTGIFADEVVKRKTQDKQRVENRPDQIDKRAFQDVVRTNIDDYDTKADAVRDMRLNTQFDKYPDNTLRKWLTSDVWTKPTKRGAPKKK